MLRKILITMLFLLAISFVGSALVSAQSATELRQQIDEYNDRIEKLDEEIKIYQQELLKIGADKSTLQNAINELNVARKKLSTDISKTENQITKANLTIEQLANEITDKEDRINKNKVAIAKILQELSKRDEESVVETLLKQENISDFWGEVSELKSLNLGIQEAVGNLEGLKFALEQRVVENKEQKKELESFRSNLANQKQAADATKREKDSLLSETQNKEDTYQDILEQKRRAREQFERDLDDLESQLQFILDPNSIPQTGTGALTWPFNANAYNPFTTITQQFGRTADSGRLYASGTHNGTDFGIPTGTEIKSTASGVVRSTGNTDIGRCLSYGKWILVDHENGLSTLYAHLSSINVQSGQTVNRGGTIGYSGSTGYSTGPHLHLTVFAREGVQVIGLGERGGTSPCSIQNVRIPVAASNVYLDPMGFLPQQ